MFHTQTYWLRTLRLHPRQPFGFLCCVGEMQAEKHRSALPRGPCAPTGAVQESGSLPGIVNFIRKRQFDPRVFISVHHDHRQGVTVVNFCFPQGIVLHSLRRAKECFS